MCAKHTLLICRKYLVSLQELSVVSCVGSRHVMVHKHSGQPLAINARKPYAHKLFLNGCIVILRNSHASDFIVWLMRMPHVEIPCREFQRMHIPNIRAFVILSIPRHAGVALQHPIHTRAQQQAHHLHNRLKEQGVSLTLGPETGVGSGLRA